MHVRYGNTYKLRYLELKFLELRKVRDHIQQSQTFSRHGPYIVIFFNLLIYGKYNTNTDFIIYGKYNTKYGFLKETSNL